MTEEIPKRIDALFIYEHPPSKFQMRQVIRTPRYFLIETYDVGKKSPFYGMLADCMHYPEESIKYIRATTIMKVALRRWVYRFRRRKAAASVIQAAFREAYYNPAYAWCKRVNERAFNSFSQHC